MRYRHDMPFGAVVANDAPARFSLWAPAARRVDIVAQTALAHIDTPMTAGESGWWSAEIAAAPAGTRYAYRIDGGAAVPDPASRFQPDGVHAPSELVDPASFEWRDDGWTGRPWEEAVIYELHVGTFTPAGTFDGVAGRLDYLADLGVTAIELMPVAAFPGSRNWGYDGVLHFAPAAAYGGPDALKRLVQAAHARGLMVLLDVVYNHFGPEGNYLNLYAPAFFDPSRHTPWGAAIAFEGAHARVVRDFYVHNALYWLDEYRIDGLRLDAVHAIEDTSEPDIVTEIAHAIRAGPGRDRHVHVVLENDRNEARYLARDASGAPLAATAQWNDDIHHAAHVIATGERDGYYADYAAAPLHHLGRCLAEGFAWQGEPSAYRGDAPRGEASAHLPPGAFVNFLQTHDQVGNRAFGDRIEAIADARALDALAACVLLAPSPPMLFMGEEFAASTPFLFFCDFGPDLAEAVTQGRRGEFSRFERFSDPEARQRIPDPNAPATFERSRLRWDEIDVEPHRRRLAHYRQLLALRREHIVPRLARIERGGRFAVTGTGLLEVEWSLGEEDRLHLLANLCAVESGETTVPPGRLLHADHGAATPGTRARLAPWSVVWTVED